MSKKKQQVSEDLYGQTAGAIGALVVVFAILGAIKDKLGLSMPVTVLLTVGVMVLIGWGAWKLRYRILAALAGTAGKPAATTTALKQEAPAAAGAGGDQVAPHPELTEALRTAGVIGRDEIIRADEVTVTSLATGKRYDFLLPKTKTVKDVGHKLANIAGWFGVSRLQLQLERSFDNERRVLLLRLDQAPFSTALPLPTRHEITTFAGVPLGHDVTGRLAGVETFDKASMLVAGMSQTGKTTLINGLITCLLIGYGEFDMYLLDGKICGLITFEKNCVRYEASDKPDVFEDIVDELTATGMGRYRQKQEALRNREPSPKFKPVIFIADEVANFFADDGTPKGKEKAGRISEKARKLVAMSLESGISCIWLTQRPDKDAIPTNVRSQFQYRLCLYVDSEGTAKVVLGDTYFETVGPINPALLNPKIKGQGVLFSHGESTLIRGFDFDNEFMWNVVDEAHGRQQQKLAQAPASPLTQAIDLMRRQGVDFIPTADLAPALGITETRHGERGKQLSKMLGVTSSKDEKSVVRGYWINDLIAAATSGP
ncbi:hypothetical protein J8N05_47070 (plasmid) [Streptomyces sp. BH-SS-21]|uniref:FtsK domain-containing protein n=1 Tax=Streptomyces liliiviolaceus TaxID=2823109 RepID=A0A940Y1T6_9ACTN|nr:FtsK/SpoIIIE domain-containing protein [Streptomyces liliiviolaceus]MBQ0855724.1 hypothetical protein [Streptomyces liliiviolaceus]